jgi:hypothetical protein
MAEKIGKNMILINAPDFQSMAKAFKMIPITNDCPYVECMYSEKDNVLAVITKTMKQSYHMVPKLDDNGDPVKTKTQRPNGKAYKEERRLVDTFSEFYLLTPEEINGFIESFAVNAKTFDYKTFTTPKKKDPKDEIISVGKPELVKKA